MFKNPLSFVLADSAPETVPVLVLSLILGGLWVATGSFVAALLLTLLFGAIGSQVAVLALCLAATALEGICRTVNWMIRRAQP